MVDKAKAKKPAQRPRRRFTQEEFDDLWTPLGVVQEDLAQAVLRAPAKPR